jgi:hypothetical protein
MFNEFLYQNKLVIEKHIKFIIKTKKPHQIYWIKKYKASHMKNLVKNLYKIKKTITDESYIPL